jgi:cold shock CspA family protein
MSRVFLFVKGSSRDHGSNNMRCLPGQFQMMMNADITKPLYKYSAKSQLKMSPLPLIKNGLRIMGKSQETFAKKELQKKKMKQRQEKAEKMEERKANAKKGQNLEDMMAYIDENGNIVSTPPDPKKKRVYSIEEVQIGVPQQAEQDEADLIRKGVITFFNDAKGFGFIQDLQTQERVFVHINNLSEPLKEKDKVTYEVEMGPKGPSAINVKKEG